MKRLKLSSGSIVNIGGSIIAVAIALLLGALVMRLSGADPWAAYKALWNGAFVGRRSISETLIYSAPLILAGLGFAISSRAGLFNIGIEGQLITGGFVAALVGAWDLGLPSVIYVPLALLAGALGGAVWGFFPGFLKARYGAHEVITTIMLNYLAIRLITYLVLRRDDILPVDPTYVATKKVVDAARLPILLDRTRLHAGILIALGAAIVLWWVLFKTRFGFNVRAVGLSQGASAYGGIKWGSTVVIAMVIAGALAGLAGAGESLGLHGRHWSTAPGYGFTAIAVGLVGRNHPIGVIFSGLLFGALNAGGPAMQSAHVSKEIVQLIQGFIILAIAALEVVNRLPSIRSRMARRASAGA
ncbi:MAG: ABC transporter permease [Thermomicrobiales bacterium]|nr:ABC transporter permease [Thermomicrobiales bacterium]